MHELECACVNPACLSQLPRVHIFHKAKGLIHNSPWQRHGSRSRMMMPRAEGPVHSSGPCSTRLPYQHYPWFGQPLCIGPSALRSTCVGTNPWRCHGLVYGRAFSPLQFNPKMCTLGSCRRHGSSVSICACLPKAWFICGLTFLGFHRPKGVLFDIYYLHPP